MIRGQRVRRMGSDEWEDPRAERSCVAMLIALLFKLSACCQRLARRVEFAEQGST
jgi:hypothetical protein